MINTKLPPNLIPKGSTPVFTEKTIPDALCNDHALAENRWGLLNLLEGSATFIDLTTKQAYPIQAPDTVTIKPEIPHKLQLDGPLRLRIDFFDAPKNSEEGTANPINLDIVRQSFDRCEKTGNFAEQFYNIFLNASPDIAPLFAKTDFDKQRKLLRATVYIMVTRNLDDATAIKTLERIGKSHSRSSLNIKPELYEIWLDSLCETIKRMDPEWTPALEQEWRTQIRPSIQFITSLY